MTCPICISNYNKSLNTEIICHYSECNYSACKQCVRTYLIGSTHEPHCMKCHNKWTAEFTNTALNPTFMKNEYKVHQKQLMVERAIARKEEFIQAAINRKRKNEIITEVKDLKSQVNKLKSQVYDLQTQIDRLDSERYNLDAIYEYNNQSSSSASSTNTRKFIMPCQSPNCNGMLSHTYKCDLCNNYTCNHCLELKGENHTCNPDSVATATAIRQDTRPCPSCGERISKIDGCDQMWCVKCKTAFSWKTGAIETKAIHNPHYFAWMREHGLEQINRCDDNDNVNIAINSFNPINTYIKYVNKFCKYMCRLDSNQSSESKKRYDCYSECKYDDIINFRNTTYKEVLEPLISNSINIESYFDMIIEFNRFVLHIDDDNQAEVIALTPENIEQDFKDVMCNYILGKYTKEELGNTLFRQSSKQNQDRAFCDIYNAFVIGGKQIMNNFANKVISYKFDKLKYFRHTQLHYYEQTEYEKNKEFFINLQNHLNKYIEVVKIIIELFNEYKKHITEFSKYINIELCKALLNYGSKRELEMWDPFKQMKVSIKCASVAEIKEKIEYFESN